MKAKKSQERCEKEIPPSYTQSESGIVLTVIGGLIFKELVKVKTASKHIFALLGRKSVWVLR